MSLRQLHRATSGPDGSMTGRAALTPLTFRAIGRIPKTVIRSSFKSRCSIPADGWVFTCSMIPRAAQRRIPQATSKPTTCRRRRGSFIAPPNFSTLLDSFLGQNDRIQVVDKDHWSIADVMTTDTPRAADSDTFWLLRLMYRSILSNDSLMTLPQDSQPGRLRGEEIDSALAGDAATERYSDPAYRTRTIQSAAAPISR